MRRLLVTIITMTTVTITIITITTFTITIILAKKVPTTMRMGC